MALLGVSPATEGNGSRGVTAEGAWISSEEDGPHVQEGM